eukprot:67501-Chlamydomonas_euryale.AAC.4
MACPLCWREMPAARALQQTWSQSCMYATGTFVVQSGPPNPKFGQTFSTVCDSSWDKGEDICQTLGRERGTHIALQGTQSVAAAVSAPLFQREHGERQSHGHTSLHADMDALRSWPERLRNSCTACTALQRP